MRRKVASKIDSLPKYKNFPVPFFVTYTKDYIPDFKVINEKNRERCATGRLCFVCGTKIGYWVTFIGGPNSCGHRLFTDGPMHTECSLGAMRICPFLLGTTDYSPDTSLRPERFSSDVKINSLTSVVPPEFTGIYLTRSFKTVTLSRNPVEGWYFLADKPVSIRWFKRGEKPIMPATEKGKKFALSELKRRRENPPPRIKNNDLPAGSPMYFYCISCSGEIVVPETYTSRAKLCEECEALKELGWLVD
jgi:hypothetical protein